MGVVSLALLTGVGVIAGFLNVMAGGGSLLTVPVMLFMGIPGPVANGSNRIAILAQNMTAAITFFRRGYSDFKLSLSLALCALPGSVVGALVGVQLHGEWFNRVVAMIMVGVIIIMALDRKPAATSAAAPATVSRSRIIWGHILMIGVGFWGGFIQLGVGFLIMPILNKVMGIGLVHTNMHKVFIVAVYTAAALIIYAIHVEILWIIGLALAIGNSFGGWLATNLQIQRGESFIKVVMYAVLSVFVIKLLFFS